MSRLTNVLVGALAAPLVVCFAAGPSWAEDVTVPGCYAGVSGQTTLCDPTVSYGTPYTVGTYQTQVPICAGSCTYVPMTWPWLAPGEGTKVCVTWIDGNDTPGGTCL